MTNSKIRNNKRRYNATYRVRQKGIQVNTRSKTIYSIDDIQEDRGVKMLINNFNYVLQIILFK